MQLTPRKPTRRSAYPDKLPQLVLQQLLLCTFQHSFAASFASSSVRHELPKCSFRSCFECSFSLQLYARAGDDGAASQ